MLKLRSAERDLFSPVRKPCLLILIYTDQDFNGPIPFVSEMQNIVYILNVKAREIRAPELLNISLWKLPCCFRMFVTAKGGKRKYTFLTQVEVNMLVAEMKTDSDKSRSTDSTFYSKVKIYRLWVKKYPSEDISDVHFYAKLTGPHVI